MFVLSVVLVVVGAVTLVLGVFDVGDRGLTFVYVSIASCLLAAVALGIGVLRGRPKRKPVQAAEGEAEASWSGAASWPTGQEPEDAAPRPHVQVVTGEEGDQGDRTEAAPAEDLAPHTRTVAADERAFQPAEVVTAAEAATAGEDAEEDIVVVPKRSAAKKSTTRKTTAKKATARKGTAKKASAKKGTARKASAKKGTAKKTSAKKTTAKKTTAKRSAGGAVETARFEAALANISGVGPTKRQQLAKHFGSFDNLRSASVDDLLEVRGVSETLARRIHDNVR